MDTSREASPRKLHGSGGEFAGQFKIARIERYSQHRLRHLRDGSVFPDRHWLFLQIEAILQNLGIKAILRSNRIFLHSVQHPWRSNPNGYALYA